jgi:hypothetical protein
MGKSLRITVDRRIDTYPVAIKRLGATLDNRG